MANKIRLGFVGANVRSTWASLSHFPALARAKGVQTAVDLHRFLDTIRLSSDTGSELPVA